MEPIFIAGCVLYGSLFVFVLSITLFSVNHGLTTGREGSSGGFIYWLLIFSMLRCMWMGSICAGKWGRDNFDVHFTETVDHVARSFFATSFTIVLLVWAQTNLALYPEMQSVPLRQVFIVINVLIYANCFATLVLYGLDAKSDESTDPAKGNKYADAWHLTDAGGNVGACVAFVVLGGMLYSKISSVKKDPANKLASIACKVVLFTTIATLAFASRAAVEIYIAATHHDVGLSSRFALKWYVPELVAAALQLTVQVSRVWKSYQKKMARLTSHKDLEGDGYVEDTVDEDEGLDGSHAMSLNFTAGSGSYGHPAATSVIDEDKPTIATKQQKQQPHSAYESLPPTPKLVERTVKGQHQHQQQQYQHQYQQQHPSHQHVASHHAHVYNRIDHEHEQQQQQLDPPPVHVGPRIGKPGPVTARDKLLSPSRSHYGSHSDVEDTAE